MLIMMMLMTSRGDERPDSEHKEPSFCTVDRGLSYQLVKALRIKLPPHLVD